MPRGKLYAASEWKPPPEMLLIATRRVRDIVGAASQSLAWKPLDLMILAESAYMQGVNDCADALAQSKTFVAGDRYASTTPDGWTE